ncbi:hypothetical protein CVT24_003784 [Panaeolus cyanescens]|uniref:Uncharacterized protein n=1 Tax=Panaeolus cyanescens TaxID=181874 RepID=A0A409W826_9AGAR|nr:hypothetical protein CVT24_003784 [Panaeolus cyanescens]
MSANTSQQAQANIAFKEGAFEYLSERSTIFSDQHNFRIKYNASYNNPSLNSEPCPSLGKCLKDHIARHGRIRVLSFEVSRAGIEQGSNAANAPLNDQAIDRAMGAVFYTISAAQSVQIFTLEINYRNTTEDESYLAPIKFIYRNLSYYASLSMGQNGLRNIQELVIYHVIFKARPSDIGVDQINEKRWLDSNEAFPSLSRLEITIGAEIFDFDEFALWKAGHEDNMQRISAARGQGVLVSGLFTGSLQNVFTGVMRR